jgi:glycerophosphoryl diester phosphodiesterase
MIEPKVPQLVAHRGYMQRFPENTWLGLEAALNAGACWIEFDIQMCAPGQFLLLHDGDFVRTANDHRSVFGLRTAQLQTISVHEPGRFEDRFAPLPPSLLADVLEQLAAFPQARAMVEIKQESLQHWGLEKVMSSLLDQLKSFRHRCVLISYDLDALRYAKRCSSIDIGWVISVFDQAHREQAVMLEPQFLICNEEKITAHEAPWEGPWQWMLYDIIDPVLALGWARRGVELIETRDIGTMLQDGVLATRACHHGL